VLSHHNIKSAIYSSRLALEYNAITTIATLDVTGLYLFTLATINPPDGNKALFEAMGSILGMNSERTILHKWSRPF
jgi:hypothetical protein